MRKAAWGAILLGVFALSLASPIRDLGAWHRPLASVSLIVGYLLVSMDPPEHSIRQRNLLIAGILCSLGSFLLAFMPLGYVANVLARILAVGTIALPVWLAAGVLRPGFIAAAILAAATIVPALDRVGGVATSTHAYVAALTVWGVAAMMHNPAVLKLGERKPPRVVVASNIVTYTPEEKARMLARLEKRFRDGDIPEHVYWDKRQEIESR